MNNKYEHFKKSPEINVISKEEFEKRVEEVFHLLWQTLSKSFGPYGAPTLIYNYPFSHVTKDGYTIMKNLSMNAAETKIDEAIKGMAADICGRLNYSVGDGTTSAIIATNSIYSNYRKMKNKLQNKFILPRDVIHKYETIKEDVIKNLETKVKPIQSSDMKELRKNIYDVVYISSNGDELFTNYIADLYEELGSPSITCRLAADGITKKTLVTGYKYDLTINDRLYINTDENTMSVHDADVVIFGTKVTARTYEYILKPLNIESKLRGRNLIVAAPSYDESALQQIIAVDLNNEYRQRHKVNLVLTSYRAISAHTRKLINDFAVLMNTIVIDRALEEKIIDELATGTNINQVFNIDGREIDNLRCVAVCNEHDAVSYIKGVDKLPDDAYVITDNYPLIENYVDLGYIRECSLGLKESHFTDMVYDKEKYNVILNEAINDLEEKEKKYQKLGTFNLEVSQAQERLYALRLKMGIIEVGADSELSQALIKDAVDDAIRAAASAFKYGVVKGCNLNLIQSIQDVLNNNKDEESVDYILLNILKSGFIDVYKTVLTNAFEDKRFESLNDLINWFKDRGINTEDVFKDKEIFNKAVEMSTIKTENQFGTSVSEMSIQDVIINYSLLSSEVFDISSFTYSDKVINSVQTDEEILKATIDLISLLIVGNQMVVTQKDY